MEDDIDIYEDLPSFEANVTGADIDDEENVSPKYEELKRQVLELTSKLEDSQRINKTLEVNLSSLLKTAKAEIARKDRMIDELRKKLDDAFFRRGVYAKNVGPNTRKNNHRQVLASALPHDYQCLPPKDVEANAKHPEIDYSCDQTEDLDQPNGQTQIPFTIFGERLRKRIAEEESADRRGREQAKFNADGNSNESAEGYVAESDKENNSRRNGRDRDSVCRTTMRESSLDDAHLRARSAEHRSVGEERDATLRPRSSLHVRHGEKRTIEAVNSGAEANEAGNVQDSKPKRLKAIKQEDSEVTAWDDNTLRLGCKLQDRLLKDDKPRPKFSSQNFSKQRSAKHWKPERGAETTDRSDRRYHSEYAKRNERNDNRGECTRTTGDKAELAVHSSRRGERSRLTTDEETKRDEHRRGAPNYPEHRDSRHREEGRERKVTNDRRGRRPSLSVDMRHREERHERHTTDKHGSCQKGKDSFEARRYSGRRHAANRRFENDDDFYSRKFGRHAHRRHNSERSQTPRQVNRNDIVKEEEIHEMMTPEKTPRGRSKSHDKSAVDSKRAVEPNDTYEQRYDVTNFPTNMGELGKNLPKEPTCLEDGEIFDFPKPSPVKIENPAPPSPRAADDQFLKSSEEDGKLKISENATSMPDESIASMSATREERLENIEEFIRDYALTSDNGNVSPALIVPLVEDPQQDHIAKQICDVFGETIEEANSNITVGEQQSYLTADAVKEEKDELERDHRVITFEQTVKVMTNTMPEVENTFEKVEQPASVKIFSTSYQVDELKIREERSTIEQVSSNCDCFHDKQSPKVLVENAGPTGIIVAENKCTVSNCTKISVLTRETNVPQCQGQDNENDQSERKCFSESATTDDPGISDSISAVTAVSSSCLIGNPADNGKNKEKKNENENENEKENENENKKEAEGEDENGNECNRCNNDGNEDDDEDCGDGGNNGNEDNDDDDDDDDDDDEYEDDDDEAEETENLVLTDKNGELPKAIVQKSEENRASEKNYAPTYVDGKLVVFARRKHPVRLMNSNANMTIIVHSTSASFSSAGAKLNGTDILNSSLKSRSCKLSRFSDRG